MFLSKCLINHPRKNNSNKEQKMEANPATDNLNTQKQMIEKMFEANEPPKGGEQNEDNTKKQENENKSNEEDKSKKNPDTKEKENKQKDVKSEGDENKEINKETENKDKYSFVPEKFKVILEDGNLDVDKSIKKLAQSYTNIESYTSRKTAENEKLKKEIELLKSSKPVKKAEESDDEIIKKLYEDPKGFLQQLKSQTITEYEESQNVKNDSAKKEQERFVSEVQDWIDLNDCGDIAKDMESIFTAMPTEKQGRWVKGDVSTMMEYLKSQVEINKLKNVSKYKPVPPKEETGGIGNPRVSNIKPKLSDIEKSLGDWFGLTEDETIKAQNE